MTANRVTMLFGRTRLHARKIADGVRAYGLCYLLRAPGNELRNPRLAMTRRLRSGLVALGDLLRRRGAQGSTYPNDCLLFVFDLGASPVTFDFATFLAGAEVERRRRGLDGIFVLFVPGQHEGLRQELPAYESAIDASRRQWRVRHVLVPLLAFLPSVRGYTICATREQAAATIPHGSAALVPRDFRVWLPRQPDKRLVHEHASAGVPIWPLLRATEHGRALVADFLEAVCPGRRPLVITLRESPASVDRNSRIDEWREFVGGLDRRRFAPIFVHDTESPVPSTPPALAGETFCEAARWNLEVRMALYEAAWLNLAVMHGPMELCWYDERSRYVVFLDVGADPSSSERSISEGGLRVGRDLEFAKPFQHIVWQADRAPIIREAFEEMTLKIEADATSTLTREHAG